MKTLCLELEGFFLDVDRRGRCGAGRGLRRANCVFKSRGACDMGFSQGKDLLHAVNGHWHFMYGCEECEECV